MYIWLAAAAAVTAPAQAQAPATVEALAQAYVTAQRGYDQATLRAITAPDFVEISPVGEVDDRTRMLSFYAAAKPAGPAMTLRDPRILRRGDHASLIARIQFTVPGPTPQVRSLRATYDAARIGGRWKLIKVQYTPMRPG